LTLNNQTIIGILNDLYETKEKNENLMSNLSKIRIDVIARLSSILHELKQNQVDQKTLIELEKLNNTISLLINLSKNT